LFGDTTPENKGTDARANIAAEPVAFPAVGDMVRVVNLNKEGVLLSEPDDSGRVEVRVGAVKVQVAAHNIEALPQQKPTAGGVAAIRIRKAVTVPEEINLIGRTTEEALPDLEKYLDDAVLAENDQVRVVHGKGTGALRNAIHRRLKSHHAVREFHLAAPNEGGEGATIVHLG
jgi:DNA mismatch repair protein MutS2